MTEFVTGGVLVLFAWALGYGATQFTEWRRRETARRERAEERRKDIYARLLRELFGIPYFFAESVGGDRAEVNQAASELTRRVGDLRLGVMLFGSEKVRAVSDEYPDEFGSFVGRLEAANDEDAKRPRGERLGTRTTPWVAYHDTLYSYVRKLAETMRKDLE